MFNPDESGKDILKKAEDKSQMSQPDMAQSITREILEKETERLDIRQITSDETGSRSSNAQSSQSTKEKQLLKEDKHDTIQSGRDSNDMLSNSKEGMFSNSKEQIVDSSKQLVSAMADQMKNEKAEGETASQVIKNYDKAQKEKQEATIKAAVTVVAAVVVTIVTWGAGSGAGAAESGEAIQTAKTAGEAAKAGQQAAASAKQAQTTAAMKEIAAKDLEKAQMEDANRIIQSKEKEDKEKMERLFDKTRELTKTTDEDLEKRQTKMSKEIVKGEMRKESLAQEVSKETGVAMKKQNLAIAAIGFMLAPIHALLSPISKVRLVRWLLGLVSIAIVAGVLIGVITGVMAALRVTLTMHLDSAPDDRTVLTTTRTLPQTWQAATQAQAQEMLDDYAARGVEADLIFSMGSPHTYETVAIWYACRTYEAPVEASTGVWAGYIYENSVLGDQVQNNSNWYHKTDDAYGGEFGIKKLAEAKDKEGLKTYNMPMSDLLALYVVSQDLNFTMLQVDERPEGTEQVLDGYMVVGDQQIPKYHTETKIHAYITTTTEYQDLYTYYQDHNLPEEVQVLADECIRGDNEGFNYLWKFLTTRLDTPETQFRYLPIDVAIFVWAGMGDYMASPSLNNMSDKVAEALLEVYGPFGTHPNTALANVLNNYLNSGNSAFNNDVKTEYSTLADIFGEDGKDDFCKVMGPLPSGVSWTSSSWNQYVARCIGTYSASGGPSAYAWCMAFVSTCAKNGTKGYFTTDYIWYLNAGLNVDNIADAGYNTSTVSWAEADAQAGTWRSLTAEQFAKQCYNSPAWCSTYMVGLAYTIGGQNVRLGLVNCGEDKWAFICTDKSDLLDAVTTTFDISIDFSTIKWPKGTPDWVPTSGSVTFKSLSQMIPDVDDSLKSSWWNTIKNDPQGNDAAIDAFPYNNFGIEGLTNDAGIAGLYISTDKYIVSLTIPDGGQPYYDTGSMGNLVPYMIDWGSMKASPADATGTFPIYFDPFASKWMSKSDSSSDLLQNGATGSTKPNPEDYYDWLDGDYSVNGYTCQYTYALPSDIANKPVICPPYYTDGDWGWYKASWTNSKDYSNYYQDAATCQTTIMYNHQKGFYIPCFNWIESEAGYYWNVDDTNSDAKFWQLCWALGQNYPDDANTGYNLLAEIPQRSLDYFPYNCGGCSSAGAWWKNKGYEVYDYMSTKDGFVPLPGDLILYYATQENEDHTISYGVGSYPYKHVGIVIGTTEPNSSGNYYIITIEGNSGSGTDKCVMKIMLASTLYDTTAGHSKVSFVCLPY